MSEINTNLIKLIGKIEQSASVFSFIFAQLMMLSNIVHPCTTSLNTHTHTHTHKRKQENKKPQLRQQKIFTASTLQNNLEITEQ